MITGESWLCFFTWGDLDLMISLPSVGELTQAVTMPSSTRNVSRPHRQGVDSIGDTMRVVDAAEIRRTKLVAKWTTPCETGERERLQDGDADRCNSARNARRGVAEAATSSDERDVWAFSPGVRSARRSDAHPGPSTA